MTNQERIANLRRELKEAENFPKYKMEMWVTQAQLLMDAYDALEAEVKELKERVVLPNNP